MTFEHSSESDEHYTPPAIVEAARATMGGIDLDPASCAEANECVQARWFRAFCGTEGPGPWAWTARAPYSPAPDFDMKAEHPTRVFLNPPGGKVGKRSSSAVWWEKLIGEWLAGNVEQAVFVCFNLEVLNTTQSCETMCLEFPICYLKNRPRFWPPGTPPELRGKTGAPKYPGAVVYVAPLHPTTGLVDEEAVARFVEAFSSLGKVVVPA